VAPFGPDAPADRPLPQTLRRFFLSAAGMDGGFFLITVAMPFKVLDLGGGALALGLVPAIGAITYILCAPLAGHLADRVRRTTLCLTGAVTLVICATVAWLVQRLELLLAVQALMGLGKALYWPAVQATLGDLSPGQRRARTLERFNLGWSTGKTLGFVAGGVLVGCCGYLAAYATGAASVVLAVVLLPRGRQVAAAGAALAAADTAATDGTTPAGTAPADGATAAAADGSGVGAGRLITFRSMAWLANTAAYGAFGILTHHLPQWFTTQGWNPDRYGWYQGAILASQTLFFLLLAGRLQLAWSAWRLWIPQLLAAAAVLAVPWLPGFAALLLTAPLIGLGCGVAYHASIFYSLAAPRARGRNAGIHEGLIGAGGFLPPLLAGLLVRAGLGLAAPYALAAALLAGGVVLQALLLARLRAGNHA
jgi:MFS family permease